MAEQRNQTLDLVGMYRSGMTLQKIADQLGVTRQAVHLRIKKIGGVDRREGGARVRSERRSATIEERLQEKRDARAMQMYGCTHDEWQKLDAAGLPDAYRAQRKNARVRGIGFLLTFSEWLQVWRESGKLDERGRTGGCYVMSRRGDVGPYAIGNVFIQLHAENVKEGFAIKRQAKNYRHQDERDLQTAACM